MELSVDVNAKLHEKEHPERKDYRSDRTKEKQPQRPKQSEWDGVAFGVATVAFRMFRVMDTEKGTCGNEDNDS